MARCKKCNISLGTVREYCRRCDGWNPIGPTPVFCEDIELSWNRLPHKRVKIVFPPDVFKLSALLDCMFNSGDYMSMHMDETLIAKVRHFTDVEVIDE